MILNLITNQHVGQVKEKSEDSLHKKSKNCGIKKLSFLRVLTNRAPYHENKSEACMDLN